MLTSTIALALFLSSYSSTLASNYKFSETGLYAQAEDSADIDLEQVGLGVSAMDFREDLGKDPTFSDSLVRQGFSPAQIQKIFTTAEKKNNYEKLPLSE